ncbi:hypothetical protein Tco_0980100 [Tanacetum coccineum]
MKKNRGMGIKRNSRKKIPFERTHFMKAKKEDFLIKEKEGRRVGMGLSSKEVDIGLDGISAGKEVDIGLDERCDKPLRPANMLLYSWDGGLDVCVDLTGSSPLKQTKMADFVPGRVVIDDAQRKRVKYMSKCAAIGYGFLPFFLFFEVIRG